MISQSLAGLLVHIMQHSLNKIPADGYLILPISMARITTGQSPELCYEILEFFEKKLTRFGVDVIILYTNGLYFNSETPAIQLRKTTSQQISSHSNRLRKLITQKRRFMPQAVHYLPWDYVLLNSDDFQGHYLRLRQAYDEDPQFQQIVEKDLCGRTQSMANVDFILEEVTATHLLRQKLTRLPKTLVQEDNFRLIAYPGAPIEADVYQFNRKLLPLNKKVGKRGYPFAAGHYDYNQQIFTDFRASRA